MTAASITRIEFDQSVFRYIYGYSKGIPRLINIACNKILSTSYTYNQKWITGDIATGLKLSHHQKLPKILILNLK
jgi:hypothetical protein